MSTSGIIYCDQCGAANRPTARFCRVWGGKTAPLSPSHASAPTPAFTGYLPRQAGSMLGGGRYQLTTLAGQGGMGAVYRALDTRLRNRPVAVKEMVPDPSVSLTEASAAFQEEAMLLASLMHPSIPRVYDYFTEDQSFFLVMDFIEGETLEERITQQGGKLSPMEVLGIAMKLCQVLSYLHEHVPPIVFRDLKPANIMLDRSGQPYLIDFGIARLFKPGQSKDTVAIGSIGYAAPEQYGKSQTTPRSDLYALATVIWQCLSGKDPTDTPFRFTSIAEAGNLASEDLQELLERLHDPDPMRRPDSASMVHHALQDILSGWGVTASVQRSQTRTKPASAPPFPGSGYSVAQHLYQRQQPSTTPKTVVLLSAEEDRSIEKELRTYLIGAFREMPVTILTKKDDMKAGTLTQRTWDEWLSSADVVLALMDVSFLSNDECYERFSHARAVSRRTIPLWVRRYPGEQERNGDYTHDGIAGLPHQRPITAFRPRERAYQEIVQGLRGVLNQR